THLSSRQGWQDVPGATAPAGVVERAVRRTTVRRGRGAVDVVLVADAYPDIHVATARFLELAAGRGLEGVDGGGVEVGAGGAAAPGRGDADVRRGPVTTGPRVAASAGTGNSAPMDMTPERWTTTCRWLSDTFGHEDAHLAGLMEEAVKAGLPSIAVSPDVGRL